MKRAKKIVVGGGTGLIGKHLVNTLRSSGYEVVPLSSKKKDWDQFKQQSTEFDVYVNLSGKNILKNPFLTKAEEERLLNSRVGPTQKFVQAIQQKPVSSTSTSGSDEEDAKSTNSNSNPKPLLIVASAVGWYNTTNGVSQPTPVVDESSPPATNTYLGQLCQAIEQAAQVDQSGARVVKLRFPVVLASDGGLFPNQRLQYRLGFGGKVGTGQQGFPWAHIDDVIGMIKYAIENEQVEGVYNVVAPEFVTQDQYSKLLAKKVGMFAWLNIPEFVLRWALGRRSNLLVEGAKINSTRTNQSGFTWRFPTLSQAFDALLGKKSS